MPIPTPDTRLFTAAELGDLLQKTVTDTAANAAEAMAWGWLRPVLGLDVRPAEISPELSTWALELGAIAHENPAGYESYQLGQERIQFSAERRAQVLLEAAGAPGGQETGPIGEYPPAPADVWPWL